MIDYIDTYAIGVYAKLYRLLRLGLLLEKTAELTTVPGLMETQPGWFLNAFKWV